MGGGACAFTKGASWVVACEPVQKGASWVVACAPSQKEHREQWNVHVHKRSIVGGGVCTCTKRSIVGGGVCTFTKGALWVVECALSHKERREQWSVYFHKRSIVGGGMCTFTKGAS